MFWHHWSFFEKKKIGNKFRDIDNDELGRFGFLKQDYMKKNIIVENAKPMSKKSVFLKKGKKCLQLWTK